MAKEGIDTKMEIILKAIILKIKKEVGEDTILTKEEFYNHNLIHFLPKSQRFIYLMALFMLENKKMVRDKVQEKLLILMEAFMMDNGKAIKSMEQGNFNMLIKQNIMDNGKEMFEKGMALITIQMEINIKVIGAEIFKME
jgi:hypothetical protein